MAIINIKWSFLDSIYCAGAFIKNVFIQLEQMKWSQLHSCIENADCLLARGRGHHQDITVLKLIFLVKENFTVILASLKLAIKVFISI